jgi:gliding motility-associated-like protein
MKKFISVKLMILIALGFSQSLVAQLQLQTEQTQYNSNKPYYYYVFPQDSIAGFNEANAQQDALNRKCFGNEYHFFLYAEKRRFVNLKYNIQTVAINPNSNTNYLNAKPIISPTNQVNNAPCVNEDFEASPSTTLTTAAAAIQNNLTGWQVTSINTGITPYNNCTVLPTTGPGNNNSWIRTTPWTPPAQTMLGTINASPFGGTKVLQMNDDLAGGKGIRIQQTFPVTASNCLFQIAYRAALLSGHACCENAYIKVKVIDCNNNVLPCPAVDVQPPGPSCASVTATGWQTNSSTWVTYTPSWMIKSLDLTPYLNSCVTILIEVGDCPYGGHWGTAYVDCQCLPMNVTVNNIVFSAAQPISFVAACGLLTATMTAPTGLGPYSWTGPPASAITNNPNQTITTIVPGNYTLVMTPPGACAPITKTINLQFGNFPVAGFSVTNVCTTYTITNTGSPAPSVQTYTILGPGGPPSWSTTANTSVVNLAPNTTYTVWQTVTNPQNCPSTFSMVITTPNGPSPAFNGPSAICISSTASFSAVVSAGSHTYSFASYTTSPGPVFTDPSGPISFPFATTYTVTHTLNSGGCVVATSSVINVAAMPSATVNAIAPTCVGSSATLNAVGGPGQLTWTGPNSYSAPGPTAMVNNFQATMAGIYTLTINNFGCIITKTVQLTAPVGPTVNITNNGPVCVGSPVVLTATWPASITPSWYYWYTYIPSPYFYSYGNYNIAQYTATTSATSAFAVPYVFWIQLSPNCPYMTFTTNVSVISVTTPIVSNTGPYCPGANIQLNSNIFTATSYTWTGPNSYTQSTVQNPTIPNASSLTAGSYTIKVGAGACTKTAVTTVSVHPVPTVSPSSNSPVCLGTSINLTSPVANSYTWTGPNGFSSNAQNPSIANAQLVNAGTYTLLVTAATGCTAMATVTVGVLTPTVAASNTGPYCAGSVVTLSATAATSYTWSGPNVFSSNAQQPTIPNAQPIASGNYTVIASVGSCTASATTSVTVNALPVPTPSNTGPYCPGQTIQFTTNAFNTYTWTGPNSFSTNLTSPTIPSASVANSGNYTVTVTNANGCINSGTTTVLVNPTPGILAGSNSPVCINTSINLTSNAASTYTWTGPNGFFSNAQNPTIPNAQLIAGGTYTLQITAATGCTAMTTVTVGVLNPTVGASNGAPICAGAVLTLSATAATSYTWSGPSAFSSNAQFPTIPNAQPVATGNYTVIASIGSCTASAVTPVVVNALPVPTPTNTGPYCPGQIIQLSVNASSTYTWTGPNSFNSNFQNPSIPSASVVNSGNYIITLKDANGCMNTGTTNVLVNPTPGILAGSNSPVCLNNSINLTSNAASTYTWTGPNGFFSNAQNPTIPNAQTVNSGTYILMITAATGCTAVTNVTVAVLTPTVAGSNTGPYCAGAVVSLSATSASSYTWTGPNAFSSNAQLPTIPNAQPVATGVYTVLATIGSCTALGTTSVTVNALPVPTPSNSGPYCVNQTIALSVNAFVSYTWTGPPTFNSNAQNPTIPNATMNHNGNFIVTVKDVNGCVNTGTTNVVVNPLPVVGVNSPTACLNDVLSLTATGGTAYSWTGPAAFASIQQNPTIPNSQIVNSGNYTVTVTSGFGCINSGVLTASVIPLPTVSIAGTNTMCSQNFNGSPAQVTINGNGANNYNFTLPPGWNGSPSLSAPSFTLFPPVTAVQAVAQLSVVGTGPFGCTNTAVYNVTVVPNPVIATTSGSMCAGTSVMLTVNGANTYNWSPFQTLNTSTGPSVIASPAVTTVYNVIGGSNGCNSQTQNATATVVANPTVVITPGTPSICIGQSINLTANGATNYSWVPGTNLSATTGPLVSANPSSTTTYSVFGEAATCTHVAAVTVTVHALPNVFVTVSSPTMCMNGHNGSPNSVTFMAGGANSFTWGGFVGITSNQTNGSSIIATSILQSALGTGTVQGFDGYCYNTASYSVVAIPNPTIAVTSNSMCFGATADISASGANTYNWSPNFNISATTGATITTFPPTTQVYNAIGSTAGCNSPTESGTVTVVALPVLIISPVNPTICAGQSIGMTGFGATNYTWTPANTLNTANGPIVIANPTVTTLYTLIGEALTCTASTVRQVSVTPLPDVTVGGKNEICRGSKTTLNANGAETYTWLPQFGMIPSEVNSNFVTLTPTVSTTYTIYGQNGPCFNAISFPVVVLDFPVLQLATNVQKVCYGKSTSIFAMGAMSYTWSPNVDMQHLQNNMVLVTPSVSTNYTVMGVNTVGSATCMMTKEILIDVVPTITASAFRTLEVCQGSSVRLSAGGSNQFVWAPATGLSNSLISQPYASPNITTTYTVHVSDGGFCTETATCVVIVHETPTVNAGEDFEMNVDDPMFLNAKGSGTLRWIVGDGVICRDCPNSQILPQNSGCYLIEARGENGCVAQDEVCIEVKKDWSIYIPNVFTPNFDGLNDTFLIYGVGISDIAVSIFDRWGEEIYHSDEQTKGWDGSVRGEEGKQDVFQYLVTFKALDGKKHTKSGHVTLLK